MAKRKKGWLKGAIKHPGALREKAEKAGAMHDGKIDKSWLDSKAKGGDEATALQARLALKMRGFHH